MYRYINKNCRYIVAPVYLEVNNAAMYENYKPYVSFSYCYKFTYVIIIMHKIVSKVVPRVRITYVEFPIWYGLCHSIIDWKDTSFYFLLAIQSAMSLAHFLVDCWTQLYTSLEGWNHFPLQKYENKWFGCIF